MARRPTDEVQLKLRFQESLRRQLERAASRNDRSMNTEIIHRLRRSLAIDDIVLAPIMLDFLNDLKSAGVNVAQGKSDDVGDALANLFSRLGGEPRVSGRRPKDEGEKK